MRGRDFVAFLKESSAKNFNEGKANFVGDDILGVPSIKISFCLKGPSRVSLRLGRARVLTTHRVVIHYARVATLRRFLQVLVKILIFCL